MPSPVPLDFLLSASKQSLQDLELSRLNHAAEIDKRLRALVRELADELATATVARLLMEDNRLLADTRQGTLEFMPRPPMLPSVPAVVREQRSRSPQREWPVRSAASGS